MLLKFSSQCFAYIIKDLFKNLYVVYFVEIKTPFSCYFMEFFVFPFYFINICSKVKLLSLILNVYFIGFQLFSEGKLYSSASLIFSNIALHIETTSLADRTYELIQEPDGDISSEAPNSNSEELKSTDSIDSTEGNPRCIILLFSNYATYYYLLVHLSYWS